MAWTEQVGALGPVAWWRLEETGGTTLAEQIQGAAFALQRAAGGSVDLTASSGLDELGSGGRFQRAAYRTSSDITGAQSAISVAVVVRFTSLPVDAEHLLSRTLPTGPTTPDIVYGLHGSTAGDGRIIWQVADGTTGAHASFLPVPGELYLIVGTWSAGQRARLYVNGSLAGEASGAVARMRNLARPLLFAGTPDWEPRRVDAFLDEPMVFYRALSGQEIAALWAAALADAGLTAPADLTVQAVGADRIELSWTAVVGATGYAVEIDGAEPIDVGTATTYAHTGVAAATSHTYRVRARDADGAGPWSSPVTGTTAATGDGRVVHLWSGAVTSSSAWVRGKVEGTSAVRLVLSQQEDFGSSTTYGPVTPTAQGIASVEATGLQAGVRYHYAFELDGVRDAETVGRFRTFPTGASSFSVIASACAAGWETPGSTPMVSNHAVFDTIRRRDPLVFLHLGDLHYRDIAVDDPGLFRRAYDDVLAESRQSALYRSAPLAYVWDDHDYGPNDSDATSPSRSAARLTYRERVPHYPLPASSQGSGGAGDAGIWQTFVIGRVRFVLTDVRSERSPKGAPDDASKLVLGEEQEAWLFNLFATFSEPALCWVNTYPWIAAASAGADHWGGYATERAKIAARIDELGIGPRMFMVSGDMHAVAVDDGRNNSWGGFPVLQFASLDSPASIKGGPYSAGVSAGANRFGEIAVADDGDTIEVTATAFAGTAALGAYTFAIAAGGAGPGPGPGPGPEPGPYGRGWHYFDRDVDDWLPVSETVVAEGSTVGAMAAPRGPDEA